MKTTGLTFLCLFGAVLPAASGMRADSLDELMIHSPFAPRAAAEVTGVSGTLEFRGVLESGGRTLVGIFDRTTGQSLWVPADGAPGETDTVVRDFDPEENTLRLTYRGRAYTLALSDTVLGDAPATPSGEEIPDVTEALAATLAAADMEPEFFGDAYAGRRLVLARFGVPPPAAPRDEGNVPALAARNRDARPPALAPAPAETPALAEPFTDATTAFADATSLADAGLVLAATDPWAGLADDVLLSDRDDGGRRLLIRRRVGQAASVRRVD